jgi:hypothetical protein
MVSVVPCGRSLKLSGRGQLEYIGRPDEAAIGVAPQKQRRRSHWTNVSRDTRGLTRYSGQSGAGGFNRGVLITNAKNAIVETTRNSGVSRVGSEAIKERFDCRPLSAARICGAVDNAAGNYQCHLGSGSRGSITPHFLVVKETQPIENCVVSTPRCARLARNRFDPCDRLPLPLQIDFCVSIRRGKACVTEIVADR